MINPLIQILSMGGSLMGLIACAILLFINKVNRKANHFLALAMFCMVTMLFATFLFKWDPRIYAYIYRFPGPLLYVFFPSLYLYARTAVCKDKKNRRWGFIHFVPAILYLIELLPHYFSSYGHRLLLVNQIAGQPKTLLAFNEGLLPSYYHTFLLCIQGGAYLFFIIQILKKNRETSGMYHTKGV